MDQQKSSYILAGVGTPVYGDRFIGRFNEIKTIEDRIVNNQLDNVSIVGLHKVGKTSLVLHTLISKKQVLDRLSNLGKETKRIFVIYIDAIDELKNNYLTLEIDELFYY